MAMGFLWFLVAALVAVGSVKANCSNNLPEPSPFDYSEPTEDETLSCCGGNFCPATCPPQESTVEFTTMEDIVSDDQEGNTLSLNITEEFPNHVSDFVTACEELFACIQYSAQFAAARSEGRFDYETRSLCFDTKYYGNNDEIGERRSFIVRNCWNERSIDEITAERDSVCQNAEVYADRLNFNVSDLGQQEEELCKEILGCMETAANETVQFLGIDVGAFDFDFDPDDVDLYSDTSDIAFETCFNKSVTELNHTRTDLCLNSALDCGESPTILNGNAPECEAEPTCPSAWSGQFEDFTPAYPSNEPGYVAATASIQTTFICSNKDRTSADAYSLILNLKDQFDKTRLVLETLEKSLPEDFPYSLFSIPALSFIRIIIQAFNTVLEQADYQDGLVQGAEIESIYENTRQLLNGSAAIYDEVVCRCVEDDSLRGLGCDSKDNNCDQRVDECDEDKFAPEIDAGPAFCRCGSGLTLPVESEPNPPAGTICARWFLDNNTAIECVVDSTVVADDCDVDIQTTIPTLFDTCYNSRITLDAEDKCGNQAVTKTVPVCVDLKDPVVSCSFENGGSPTPNLIVMETGAGVQYDVKLDYTATDNCGGPLDVEVKVFVNEIEDFQSQEMALIFQNDTVNDKAGLYIASTTCTTAANGQCIRDDNLDLRLYTVVISAVDPAGRTAQEAECTILIVPSNMDGTTVDISVSKQRFFLTSYSSVFTEYSPSASTEGGFVGGFLADPSLSAGNNDHQIRGHAIRGGSDHWIRGHAHGRHS